jgi:3-deoxy-D-manno-octulosonic-acid transferase
MFSSFANILFSKFDLCLSSSKNSTKYLKNLGAKNIKNLGNLKFTQSEKKNSDIKKNLKKFIKTKKVWCASSTHFDEEKLCGLIHQKLKKRYKNLLTIIIPRHVNRINTIKKDLLDLGLNIHLDEPKKNINRNTDIYLVNTYGKTKTFYSNCKNVFLGGSIINHGGQNPLEATRFGCNILHGKNVSNFQEIYKFLSDNNISQSVNSISDFIKKLDKLFSMKKITTNTIKNKIDLIGSKVLSSTYKEINLFLKNDF